MAHYNKKSDEPVFMEDKRRTELAAVMLWLRKNCVFCRIEGALHAAIITKTANNLFGAGGSSQGDWMRLNIALPVILKKLNGNNNYHQIHDIMKACHLVADDFEREEMTRRREARAKRD